MNYWRKRSSQFTFDCKDKRPSNNELNIVVSFHSSYALENDNEVIEVLYKKEELLIESSDNDTVTMMVDPLKVSIQDVKDYIEQTFNIGVNEQHLRISGQDVDENDPLSNIFLSTKKKPVVRMDKTVNGSER